MSRARCAPPSCSAASAMAATSSVCSSTARPAPGEPINRAGTSLNSHRASLLVWSSVGRTRRRSPAAVPSTANSDRAAGPDESASVTATARIRSAPCPSSTKLLCPSSRQPCPFLAAASRTDSLAQDPSSSVNASVATVCPEAMPGSRSRRAPSSSLAPSGGRGQHRAGQVRPGVQGGAELLEHDGLLGEARSRRRRTPLAIAMPCRPSWSAACRQTPMSMASAVSISSRTRDSGARSARKRRTDSRSSRCSALTPRFMGPLPSLPAAR